jgi:uncharacterized protein YndB with AHSA1/START domain
MRLVTLLALIAAVTLAWPPSGRAEVLEILPGGFAVQHVAEVSADAEAVWQAMMYRIEDWWNPEHSWSKDAANLYIDARLGGCFCERLPQSGGAVEHLRIIYLEPPKRVRLDGALGPLVEMPVQGRMIWSIEATEGGGSRITFSYRVHGALEDGFAGLAPAVDGVIGEQLQRLTARFGED